MAGFLVVFHALLLIFTGRMEYARLIKISLSIGAFCNHGYFTCLNFNDRMVLIINYMKMRRFVVIAVHLNDDSKKTAEFWHLF
jgi:hypothetical protein